MRVLFSCGRSEFNQRSATQGQTKTLIKSRLLVENLTQVMFSRGKKKKHRRLSDICHWRRTSVDPIKAAPSRERQIILTATKDTLTVSGVDEADRSDGSFGSLARDEGPRTVFRHLTDSNVIRLF